MPLFWIAINYCFSVYFGPLVFGQTDYFALGLRHSIPISKFINYKCVICRLQIANMRIYPPENKYSTSRLVILKSVH